MQNEDPTPPALQAAKSDVQRKSLDQREQMNDLMRLRHSAAHILATAVLRLWPDARLDIGPPTEEGFYYDFDLAHRFSPEDFGRIEEEMRKVVKENQEFKKFVIPRDEALLFFRSKGQTFKVERLADIPEGEAISFYVNGDFTDLCAGPHVMRTGNVKAFKLLSVASAYFRGNEKNPQLQRLYGTAFKGKEELENWLKMQEEARKRDHRKIGADMGLFAFDSEFTGPGLPLWLPKGGAIIEELEKLAKETEFQAGYVRVKTPHIARERMYKTSGHLPYYADSMFPPMQLRDAELERDDAHFLRQIELDEANLATVENMLKLAGSLANAGHVVPFNLLLGSMPEPVREQFNRSISDSQKDQDSGKTQVDFDFVALKKFYESGRKIHSQCLEEREVIYSQRRYFLKAMNCPHHHRIFAAEPRSYRDLPLRLAEYGTCYRYEQSGELQGLMRVRSMQMNDAHIYCQPEKFAEEFQAVNEMYLKYFKIFGFEKYQMRFSTHGPEGLGKKYVNEPELWKQTEDMVRRVLVESGINFVEVANEAAFYGPKIDVQVWSVAGREFTIATNQVDFAVPAKFGLTYRDKDNTNKTPLCIHRAPLGTHERFIAFLIEHYAGNFPLWLAPDQVRVLTLGDEPALVDYAKAIVTELRSHMVRAEGDYRTDPIKAKIQTAEERKVHTMLVIGGRDMEAGAVSVRVHGKGNLGAKPKAEVIADLLAAVRERRA